MMITQSRDFHSRNHGHADAGAKEDAEDYFLAIPHFHFPKHKDRNHDNCVLKLDQENHYSSQKDAVKNLPSKSVVMSRAIAVAVRARLMVGPVPGLHFTTAIKKTRE